MSDYPMLISNKLHSFRNFLLQNYDNFVINNQLRYNFIQNTIHISALGVSYILS